MLDRRSVLLTIMAGVVSLTRLRTSLAGHGHCCPECGKVCQPEPTTIKTKKTVFGCECKDICIPSVKGPFADPCAPPRCGRVRTIKVLTKKEIECEHCGYKWKVVSVGCHCEPKTASVEPAPGVEVPPKPKAAGAKTAPTEAK